MGMMTILALLNWDSENLRLEVNLEIHIVAQRR